MPSNPSPIAEFSVMRPTASPLSSTTGRFGIKLPLNLERAAVAAAPATTKTRRNS